MGREIKRIREWEKEIKRIGEWGEGTRGEGQKEDKRVGRKGREGDKEDKGRGREGRREGDREREIKRIKERVTDLEEGARVIDEAVHYVELTDVSHHREGVRLPLSVVEYINERADSQVQSK